MQKKFEVVVFTTAGNEFRGFVMSENPDHIYDNVRQSKVVKLDRMDGAVAFIEQEKIDFIAVFEA